MPAHEISVLIALGSNKGSGESAQLLACTKYRCRKKVKPKFRPGSEVIKPFAMLNSAKHNLFSAHKC